MSILAAISHSSQRTGIRAVLAGVEKVGKTTLGCSAPRPLLIPLEIGFASMQVNKTPLLETFAQVMSLLDEITVEAQAGRFVYQSLIVDSATALERLIHQAVLEGIAVEAVA